MKKYLVMIWLCAFHAVHGAYRLVYMSIPPDYLSNLYASDYVSSPYQPERDHKQAMQQKTLCDNAISKNMLREKLYQFPQTEDAMTARLGDLLQSIPKGLGVQGFIIQQFTGCVKNSWEIDLLVDELVRKTLIIIKPPLSFAEQITYRDYIKKVVMVIAQKM